MLPVHSFFILWEACKIAVSIVLLSIGWHDVVDHHGIPVLTYVFLFSVQSCIEIVLHIRFLFYKNRSIELKALVATRLVQALCAIYGIISVVIVHSHLHHFKAVYIWACVWAGFGAIYLAIIALMLITYLGFKIKECWRKWHVLRIANASSWRKLEDAEEALRQQRLYYMHHFRQICAPYAALQASGIPLKSSQCAYCLELLLDGTDSMSLPACSSCAPHIAIEMVEMSQSVNTDTSVACDDPDADTNHHHNNNNNDSTTNHSSVSNIDVSNVSISVPDSTQFEYEHFVLNPDAHNHVVLLSCNHIVHLKCLFPHSPLKPSFHVCPQCRSQLYIDRDIRRSLLYGKSIFQLTESSPHRLLAVPLERVVENMQNHPSCDEKDSATTKTAVFPPPLPWDMYQLSILRSSEFNAINFHRFNSISFTAFCIGLMHQVLPEIVIYLIFLPTTHH